MSASSDSSRLLATALGAAVAGAALGAAALKLAERLAAKNVAFSPSQGRRQNRSSYIYEEDTATSTADTLVFPHNHEEKMRRRLADRAVIEEDNYIPRDSVTVRVPATSANMGPGCTFVSVRFGVNHLLSSTLSPHSHSLSYTCAQTTRLDLQSTCGPK